MKNKTKILKYILISLAVIIACGALFMLIFRNRFISNDLLDEFEKSVSGYEGIEIVESKSIYGKLNGNGNGIDYFGAVLVKNESQDALGKIVSELSQNYDIVEYTRQKTAEVDSYLLEHKSMVFDKTPEPDEEYYCIYYFHSSDKSNNLDIAGH